MKFGCRFLLVSLFLCASVVNAQPSGREKIIEALEKDGCVTLETGQVKICKYDYVANGQSVEAISFQPLDGSTFPALMLIPGYQRSARDYLPLGTMFAKEGFACVAVTQPGFGKSQGKSDFVGPQTIKALIEGFNKFKHEPFVDARRMGIFGYSRGAMAASLLAVRLVDVRAAVFGGGIYDFKKAYDEIKNEGIRKNMEQEAGLTPAAIKERSSLPQMKKLRCPVLILHGEKDENAPVSQALLLRDRLTALKKEFELKIFPAEGHGLSMQDVFSNSLAFFKRQLMAKEAKGAHAQSSRVIYDGRTETKPAAPSEAEVQLVRRDALPKARQFWRRNDACTEGFEVVGVAVRYSLRKDESRYRLVN
jgi:pimeloyl-ACP methyl ester carboxylesterase